MSDPYAMAAALKAQAAADYTMRQLNDAKAQLAADPLVALKEQLTRLEVKIDTIGILLAGPKYVQNWDKSDFHQSAGMK